MLVLPSSVQSAAQIFLHSTPPPPVQRRSSYLGRSLMIHMDQIQKVTYSTDAGTTTDMPLNRAYALSGIISPSKGFPSHWINSRLNINIIVTIIRYVPEGLPPLLLKFFHQKCLLILNYFAEYKKITNIMLTFNARSF